MIVRPPSARDLSNDTHWKHDALSRPLTTDNTPVVHLAILVAGFNDVTNEMCALQ